MGISITSGIVKSAQKIVVYGPEGIGKSTFASKFPNCIFSDTEGSTKRLDVKRFDRPTSFEMLLQQVDYVKSHPKDFSTYIIDTADWAEKLCGKSICAKYKKSGIEEFGYGKGYVFQAEEFGRLLNLLEDLVDLGVNVVMTAHAVMRKFEQPDEAGAYDRWELKLDKRTGPMLKEWADAVLFVNYKTVVEKHDDKTYKASGGKRVMYTQHHPCWDAKNRYDLPSETEFDYNVIAPFIPTDSAVVNDSIQNFMNNAIVDDKPEQNIIPAFVEVPAVSEKVKIPDGIPTALADLMRANDVSEEDIQLAVSQKGYFPKDTKIADYGEDFINGCLISCWPQVYSTICSNNDLPFN